MAKVCSLTFSSQGTVITYYSVPRYSKAYVLPSSCQLSNYLLPGQNRNDQNRVEKKQAGRWERNMKSSIQAKKKKKKQKKSQTCICRDDDHLPRPLNMHIHNISSAQLNRVPSQLISFPLRFSIFNICRIGVDQPCTY